MRGRYFAVQDICIRTSKIYNYIVASLHTSADRGRQFSQKLTCAQYLDALCRNCVGGGGSSYGAYFAGHVVLQIVHSASAVCAYIGRQRARNFTDDAGFVEIFVLPHAQIRGRTPNF